MNNRLLKMQEMIYRQMERIDNDELMIKGLGQREIQRSSSLTALSSAFIKNVQTGIKIKEIAKKNNEDKQSLLKELGVVEND